MLEVNDSKSVDEVALAETYREQFETELPRLVRGAMKAVGIDGDAEDLAVEIERELIEDDLRTRFEEDELPALTDRQMGLSSEAQS